MNALGSGTAHTALTQSPFHAMFRNLNDSHSKVADIGTIAHRILLEGHEDDIVLVDAPDWRTSAAKIQRDAAYVDGKTPLLLNQIDGIRAMVESAREFIGRSEIAGFLGNGNPEVTVDWLDNGVPCKARPDYLTNDWHISLKTTNASGGPEMWLRRQLSPLGYDFSLAFYDRGLLANDCRVEHRILVIEQQPPYGCFLIALAPDKKVIAQTMVDMAIKKWGECLASGVFPCYSTETYHAEATAYELADAEERELAFFATGVAA